MAYSDTYAIHRDIDYLFRQAMGRAVRHSCALVCAIVMAPAALWIGRPESLFQVARNATLNRDSGQCWFVRSNGLRAEIVRRDLATAATQVVFTSAPSSELDFVPNAAFDKLLIIEWTYNSPGWTHFYKAHVVIARLDGTDAHELIGPKDFPSAPVWVSSNRIGVLLDGVKTATVDIHTGVRDQLGFAGTDRLSRGYTGAGSLPVLLKHLELLGIKDKRVSKRSPDRLSIRSSGQGQDTGAERAMIRASGLVQYPADWLTTYDGLIHPASSETSLCNTGKLYASTSLMPGRADKRPEWIVQIVRTVDQRVLWSINLEKGSAIRLHWSNDDSALCFTLDGTKRTGGVYYFDMFARRLIRIGPGQNGYIRYPAGRGKRTDAIAGNSAMTYLRGADQLRTKRLN